MKRTINPATMMYSLKGPAHTDRLILVNKINITYHVVITLQASSNHQHKYITGNMALRTMNVYKVII